jgi:hypothetical protein
MSRCPRSSNKGVLHTMLVPGDSPSLRDQCCCTGCCSRRHRSEAYVSIAGTAMATSAIRPPAGDDATMEQAFLSVLQQTDGYMQKHEAACSCMKRGWFNIARARHVMGMHQARAASCYCRERDGLHASAQHAPCCAMQIGC